MRASGRSSLIGRLVGVLTLRARVYREIADDTTATGQAAIIVVVMSLIAGALGAAVAGPASSIIPQGFAPAAISPVRAFVTTLFTVILGWLFVSWVFAFVSRMVFRGRTNTLEMARVFGFTQIFQTLNVIPVVGWLVGLVLSVIGAIIGIREASKFDTGKAILTGIVGFVVLLVIRFILTLVFAALPF